MSQLMLLDFTERLEAFETNIAWKISVRYNIFMCIMYSNWQMEMAHANEFFCVSRDFLLRRILCRTDHICAASSLPRFLNLKMNFLIVYSFKLPVGRIHACNRFSQMQNFQIFIRILIVDSFSSFFMLFLNSPR